MIDAILRTLDTQRETVIALQRELVRREAIGPASAPPGCQAEAAKAEFALNYLQELGVGNIVRVDAPDERVASGLRPNFAGIIPGRDTSRTLWVISHLDIVPPGDLSLWNSDPFALRVEGDTMYGRGVEDNHQGIVSSLLVAKALQEHKVTPPINYGVFLVSDEETGSIYGLHHVLKERPDLFKPDDLLLIPDFGSPDSTMVEVAEKSMLWLKVMVTGRQCHASTPQQGINSLRAAAALILRIDELYRIFDLRNELFEPQFSTFAPTRKEENVPNINTVPGYDVFYVDCRVLAEYPIDDVVREIGRLAREVEAEHGVTISMEPVQKHQAAPMTDPESPIVQRLAVAIEAVYGKPGVPRGIGGGTVAAALRERGYPAAVWATCVHNAHQPNESSLISTQIGDAKVIARVLMQNE